MLSIEQKLYDNFYSEQCKLLMKKLFNRFDLDLSWKGKEGK